MDERESSLTDIAVIGMAGRFPGADTIEAFWQNLRDGVESISFFADEELLAAGVDPDLLNDRDYVRARGIIPDAEQFDAAFFGFSPKEAEIIDPQQRLFLECAGEVLERAGYNPDSYAGKIGVFAGVGMNTYLLNNLLLARNLTGLVGLFQLTMSNDKDFLPTRVSYQLNLKGPSVSVNTACSTSLVAVVLACQSLLMYQSDMVLAGGVSIRFPQRSGYLYQPDGILSPDGHCRAFDAAAQGTVGGDGVGVVILKRLADALADGDTIHAVIKGAAINNDGAIKVGYTAPSVSGQAEVVAEALALAGVDPETIGYIETHGTGTALGDPIEIAALTQVFRASTARTGFCAIGSLKTNVGHLDSAAGVAGLIKTVLALQHRQLPPSLHFEQPNPQLMLESSPFYVSTRLAEWPANGTPRRAGVSAFGIGGTNAHVILEEAPAATPTSPARPWQLLVISAKTPAALERATDQLAAHLRRHPDLDLADAAYTLQVGRKMFAYRRALVCRDHAEAARALEQRDSKQVITEAGEPHNPPVLFMFPGGGAQYVDMGRELYQAEPVFRQHIDECLEILRTRLGLDLRRWLYPDAVDAPSAAEQLTRPLIGLPLLFLTEYAMAKLWMSWGIRPAALIGHSLGEYAAACLAGVIGLEDALALVATRGRLFEQLPAGSMLSVALPEEQIRPLLGEQLAIAAVNAPDLCVVSGPAHAVEALEARLTAQDIHCVRVKIAVAAHSPMVEPILDEFARFVYTIALRPPQIPYLSNLSGTWITAEEATDPDHWVRHLRLTVRFADGIGEVTRQPGWVLLEIGPGRTLSTLVQQSRQPGGLPALTSMRHPRDQQPDLAFALSTLGRLWAAGLTVDWAGFYAHEQRRRVVLPTYPFERQRYAIDAAPGDQARPAAAEQAPPAASKYERPDLGQAYVAPRDEVERRLAEIWQELLGIARVGIEDTFFEMGGQSLLATRLMSRVRSAFQVEMPLQTLFDAPTIAGLAAAIAGRRAERPADRAADDGGAAPDGAGARILPQRREAGLAPLSFAQQRLWVLEQLDPGLPTYNVPLSVRIGGALDAGVLEQCLNEIVRRHETLRTEFVIADGQPFQRVVAPPALRVPVTDLRHLSAEAQEAEVRRLAAWQGRQPFDLGRAPLLRASLLRLAEREHVALLTIHHIVFDGWSMGILIKEMADLYAAHAAPADAPPAAPLPELPIQYADFAQWQREWLRGEVYASQLAYWRDQLGGLAALELPTDRPRPPIQTSDGAWQYQALAPELSQQLNALAQRHGATLFMALLAAFKTLLYRYTGQSDVVVGTPIAGRTRAETERLIGFFVNTLVLRTDLGGSPSFLELLRRVRETTLAAYAHQDLPFEQIVEEIQPERDLSRTPLFQVMFVFENTPRETLELPGLTLRLIDADNGTAKFDLTMFMEETSQGLAVALEYNTNLFEDGTIARMLGHWYTLLEGILAHPEAPIDALPLLTAAEREELAAWNDTRAAAPPERCVHQIIEEQAARTPDAMAVVFERPTTGDKETGRQGDRETRGDGGRSQLSPQSSVLSPSSLTYRELDLLANYLAHHLRSLGIGPERLVGICMGRSAELAVAILAVLKAGGAYLPLDPAYPGERLARMLADARADVILTRREFAAALPDGDARVIRVDRADEGWVVDERVLSPDELPARGPATTVYPDNPVYVIYTSGSTGTPKGVVVEHRQLVHYVASVTARLELGECASFALISTFGADLGNTVLFPALMSGGCLHLISEDRASDPVMLAEYLRENPVDCLKIVPSHLAALLGESCPAEILPRRRLILGGEAARWELIDRVYGLLPDCRIFNHYGPTEATVGAITCAVTPARPGADPPAARPQSVPLGRPLANTRICILDARLNQVPVGVPGELYIGGAGVTRGYLDRPDLTAERFIPNPFASAGDKVTRRQGDKVTGEQERYLDLQSPISNLQSPDKSETQNSRLYRTGDLARYRPDGNIEFLGRIDHQVKIRGFRIELGEIEAALARHPAVQASAVMAREYGPGELRLVAYVVPTTDKETRRQGDKETRRQGDKEFGDASHTQSSVLSPQSSVLCPQDSAPPSSLGVELRGFLKERLPEYMVPSAFVMLEALPLTPNGKLDRRALPLPEQPRPEPAAAFATPRTAIEETLAGIWAGVLRLERVGIHDNFFELGGDSILSIQIISRANQAGLRLTPRQLFQHPTIAALAPLVGVLPQRQAEQGPLIGPVPLTPIQRRFFEQDLADPQHWNQSLLIETRQALDPELLAQSFQQLMAHHDALRLRFAREDDGWRQVYAEPGQAPFCERIDLSALPTEQQAAAIRSATADIQAGLRFDAGPLLRLALFDLGPGRSGRLFVAVHHLLIDAVSWRVLLEDLQSVYTQLQRGQAPALPPKTTSYRQWAGRLLEHARSETCTRELAYWLDPQRALAGMLPLDGTCGAEANTVGAAGTLSVALDVEETRALLHELPARYHSQINEVLLTALARACADWSGASRLLVDLEGHGREDLFEDIDLSRTIGWFTSVFPVLLDLGAPPALVDPVESLKRIKEQLRGIPQRGIGYGLLRYMHPDRRVADQLRALPQSQVSFNYLGQLDQALADSAMLAPAPEPSGPARSPRGRRRYLIDVNGFVSGGRLEISWTYAARLHRRATVEALAERFLDELRALIYQRQAPASSYTPSDFPEADLSQASLDRLMARITQQETTR